MGLIFNLSLRNLLRQKKRNFLLGLGIAFGMMIMVIANSFSHGMVDVLINEVVSNAFGHLVIDSKPGNSSYSIIRDKERIEKLVRDTINKEDLVNIKENMAMFGRAVGNGETDNIVVVGFKIDNQKEREQFFHDFFTLVDGNYKEYDSNAFEYPVIISEQKAQSLNVKVHDVIRVRVPMVTGQLQVAKLTVVAIVNANNTFMNIVLFMDGERVKKLLGYKPWETASLRITLKNPEKTSAKYADLIHQKLQPKIIAISGMIGTDVFNLLAYKNTSKVKHGLEDLIQVIQGVKKKGFNINGVMISEQAALKLGAHMGDEITFKFQTKYRGEYQQRFKIDMVYKPKTELGTDILLVNEERIHNTFNRNLPANSALVNIRQTDVLYPLLATEWKLMDRSADSVALQEKYRKDRMIKTNQTKFDVITMYEGASNILKLEGVMNLVTLIAVLVLFFIILIGVMNTLRMTINERTREIGTVRAIGMQKNDVRNMFIMETLQLTALSCLAGILLGVLVMQILGAIQFDVTNSFSMILKDKHFYFKINPMGLLTNFTLIIFITALTAFFPARRAARLTAVEALRHYE